MQNNEAEIYQLYAELCQTLAHPKRLEILDAITKKERSVGELARMLNIPQANLSQHLALLKQRKLVVARRKGINIYYRLSDPKIISACRLLKEVLHTQLSEGEKLAESLGKFKGLSEQVG